MKSLFISHNWNDKPFVRKLAADLDRWGIRYWVDEAEIEVGDSLITKIRNGIDEMDYVAVVLSPDSIDSPWVQKEVDIAMNQEIDGRRIRVLPLLYRPCEMPGFLKGKFYADFSSEENYETALKLVLRRLGVSKDRLEGQKRHEMSGPHKFPANINETQCPNPYCGTPYSISTFAAQIRQAFPAPEHGEILQIKCDVCGHVASWIYQGEWDQPSNPMDQVLQQLDSLNLQTAAEAGDAKEQCNLAVYYVREGDLAKAVFWYKRAVLQGYPQAQFNLAVLLQNGQGIQKDEALAVDLYQKAAAQGYVNAMYNLGFMKENGFGCKKDKKAALELYTEASSLGDADSQCKVGLLLQDDESQRKIDSPLRNEGWEFVTPNYTEAKSLLEKARKQGHRIASEILSTIDCE